MSGKHKKSPEQRLEEVARRDGRYPLEAFGFLHEGLARAVSAVHGESGGQGPHHVSGRDLCLAMRDEALERWGLLARAVLRRWNIHTTRDFGNLVYLMVDNDLMQKTEEDSIEDFEVVYDFERAFEVANLLEAES